MSERDEGLDRQRLDRRARAQWQDADARVSSAMQGRLRAARRQALARPARPAHRSMWPLAMPAVVAGLAVLAVVVGLRLSGDRQQAQPPTTTTAAPAATTADVTIDDQPPAVVDASPTSQPPASNQDAEAFDVGLAMYEADPDFYLWLGSQDTLPATLEPRHDPT